MGLLDDPHVVIGVSWCIDERLGAPGREGSRHVGVQRVVILLAGRHGVRALRADLAGDGGLAAGGIDRHRRPARSSMRRRAGGMVTAAGAPGLSSTRIRGSVSTSLAGLQHPGAWGCCGQWAGVPGARWPPPRVPAGRVALTDGPSGQDRRSASIEGRPKLGNSRRNCAASCPTSRERVGSSSGWRLVERYKLVAPLIIVPERLSCLAKIR